MLPIPETFPESLADKTDLETAFNDATDAAAAFNRLARIAEWIETDEDAALPTECIDGDECCEWRQGVLANVAAINGIISDIEADLGDQNTEDNRAAFADTDPELGDGSPVSPALPDGGCDNEQTYIDLWDEAVFNNTFLAAFQEWCNDDEDNCPTM